MNNEKNNIENIEGTVPVKEKKKQKAPLGIRPNDYVEEKFREMVNNSSVHTMTTMFEKLVMDKCRADKEALKLENLDCSLEIQNIKAATITLTKSYDAIISKVQSEIKSKNRELNAIKEATDTKIELANIELSKKITELEEKNKELEAKNKELEVKLADSNSIVTGYNSLKENLNNQIVNLKSIIEAKDVEIDDLNSQIKERDKAIKSLEKEIDNNSKAISNIEKEITLIEKEKKSAQEQNQSLKDTLTTFHEMKAAEIEAIKSNVATMSELKLSSLEATKNAEIDRLNATITTLKESLDLKTQENSSLSDTYNNIVEAREKELEAIFNKEKTLLESTISKKNAEIEELKMSIKVASDSNLKKADKAKKTNVDKEN